MSRTLKDEPYEVRARKNGKIRHIHRCNAPKSGVYRNIETTIFFAHEVAELEVLKNETLEAGHEFVVKEEHGHLLSMLSGWNRWGRYETLDEPKRLSVEKNRTLPKNAVERTDRYEMSKYNVFYICTVIKTRVWEDTEPCCGPEMPAKLVGGRKDCGCCCRKDRREAITIANANGNREQLVESRNLFNSGELPIEDDLIEDFENLSEGLDCD